MKQKEKTADPIALAFRSAAASKVVLLYLSGSEALQKSGTLDSKIRISLPPTDLCQGGVMKGIGR
jgi:hypothetical protein